MPSGPGQRWGRRPSATEKSESATRRRISSSRAPGSGLDQEMRNWHCLAQTPTHALGSTHTPLPGAQQVRLQLRGVGVKLRRSPSTEQAPPEEPSPTSADLSPAGSTPHKLAATRPSHPTQHPELQGARRASLHIPAHRREPYASRQPHRMGIAPNQQVAGEGLPGLPATLPAW